MIDTEFANLPDLAGEAQRSLREKLAAHFIQRRRRDIDAWHESGLFPRHETSELKYRFTGAYADFYGRILDYCAEIVLSAEGDARQRLAFWGTLALMRCVGSSPAAAVRALRTRAQLDPEQLSEAHIAAQILDDEELTEDDLEPGAGVEDPRLAALIGQAEALAGNNRRRSQMPRALQGPQGTDPRRLLACRLLPLHRDRRAGRRGARRGLQEPHGGSGYRYAATRGA